MREPIATTGIGPLRTHSAQRADGDEDREFQQMPLQIHGIVGAWLRLCPKNQKVTQRVGEGRTTSGLLPSLTLRVPMACDRFIGFLGKAAASVRAASAIR